MSTARLTASLLAPKGSAFPLGNAYANPHLDPLPARRESRRRTGHPGADDARCRIETALYARLRILAARRGRSVRALLEAAVADFLSANGRDCPCLGPGPVNGTDRAAEVGCCRDVR